MVAAHGVGATATLLAKEVGAAVARRAAAAGLTTLLPTGWAPKVANPNPNPDPNPNPNPNPDP